MFILKSENQDWWIAHWEDGDPPRTMLKESARQFKTKDLANKYINKIKKEYWFRKINLIIEEI
jgi:hypothetical protein